MPDAAAWLFDGSVATRQDVMVRSDGDRLTIVGSEVVETSDLITIDFGGRAAFGRKSVPGWRLGFDVPPDPAIAALLPVRQRYGGWIDRLGLVRASIVFAALSAAIILVVISAPEYLAPHVPWRMEKAIGKALIGDLGGKVCKGPGGQAALDAVTRRIDTGGEPVTVRAVNIPILNAVALPGGTILVFDGLLRQAQSPDELAGVVAHELGHVRERHVMRALLREAGLGMLLGSVGGNVGTTINTLTAASYTREAEAAADSFSIRALQHAEVDPTATSALFVRLAKQEEEFGAAAKALSYINTHPVSKERAALFAKSARPGTAYRPAIDGAQWQALVAICSSDPARRNDKMFDIFR